MNREEAERIANEHLARSGDPASGMAAQREQTLTLTCPTCQHTWPPQGIPAIPWRALPAFLHVVCPACQVPLLVTLRGNDQERWLHVSITESSTLA